MSAAGSPIRSQVLWALLFAGLLPIALMLVATQTLTRRAYMDHETSQMGLQAREAAHQVAQKTAERVRVLRRLANEAYELSSPDWAAPLLTPDPISRFLPYFSDVTLYAADGRLLAMSEASSMESFASAPWLALAFEGQVAISSPYMVLGDSQLHVALACPLHAADDTIGSVVSVSFPLGELTPFLEMGPAAQGAYMAMADARGNILYHPDATRLLTRLPPGALAPDGRGLFADAGHAQFVSASCPVPLPCRLAGSEWHMISIKPESTLLAFPLHEMRLQGWVALLTLVVVMALGLLLSRQLTRPLIRVARGARRISQGELSERVPEQGPLEVRQLAEAINGMVNELTQHRNRLEQMVQQRTLRLRDSQRTLEQLAAHLRATYESITDGILIAEWPSGRIITANRHFLDLFGFDPDSLTGTVISDLDARIRDRFVEPRANAFRWEHFLRHAEESGVEEWEVGGGEPRTLAVHTAPVGNNQGQVFARLWMFRDLTRQRFLEAELLQAQKMEAIGRLAGGIAHDFNNLLTGIIGNLSMAQMEHKLGADPTRFMYNSEQASKRAADLVQKLLGFSRRGQLELAECNVNDIAIEVETLLRHTIDPRVSLELELDEAVWIVRADSTQIQQVLMNLCVNAVDAMPNGGCLSIRTGCEHIEPTASHWADATPGDYVHIHVQDNGDGIPQEVQCRMFEPFFTTKEPGKGTGLGLAMSYGIVKQHGGWIACDSELGAGTAFHVFLPRLPEEARRETVRAAGPAAVVGGHERILVVDDEPAVRTVITVVLQKYGYDVAAAADGEEALALFEKRRGRFDLVLLDLTMPKLPGKEVFRRLRKIAPDLLVVISSGYPVDLPSFERETGSRPSAVIPKPFDVPALAGAIRAVLDSASVPA